MNKVIDDSLKRALFGPIRECLECGSTKLQKKRFEDEFFDHIICSDCGADIDLSKIQKGNIGVSSNITFIQSKVINILYYRNVPRNVVMVKTGDYETLRKLEQEIRLRDPGNYLALHKLEPIKEEEIESIVKEVFNESTSI